MGKGMNSPHGHQAEEEHLGDGAACGGAVGVGEELPEPRQCGGARNPRHGEALRSPLVAVSGESRWGKDLAERGELEPVLCAGGFHRNWPASVQKAARWPWCVGWRGPRAREASPPPPPCGL